MTTVAVVTTLFFAAVIIAAWRGLLTTQAARLAARAVAQRLDGSSSSVAQQLEWLHGVIDKWA